MTMASSMLTLILGFALAAGAGDAQKDAAGRPSTASTAVHKRWALATSAMLTERNGGRHDLLGGAERSEGEVRATRRLLSEWWGVDHRDDLLRALKWIDDGGHRAEFDRLRAKLTPVSAEQRTDLHERVKHDLYRVAYRRLLIDPKSPWNRYPWNTDLGG
jgi:hypothetical protein